MASINGCNNICANCDKNLDGWCVKNDFSVFAHSSCSINIKPGLIKNKDK